MKARKKRRKTSVVQTNSKVTLHIVTSLRVMFGLSTLYFKKDGHLTEVLFKVIY